MVEIRAGTRFPFLAQNPLPRPFFYFLLDSVVIGKTQNRQLVPLSKRIYAAAFAVVMVSNPWPWGPVSRILSKMEKASPTNPKIEKIHIPSA